MWLTGWLSGGRLLASCGAAAAGVTSLLLLGYCFVPPATVLDSAHGLGFAGIGTGRYSCIPDWERHTGYIQLKSIRNVVMLPCHLVTVNFVCGITFHTLPPCGIMLTLHVSVSFTYSYFHTDAAKMLEHSKQTRT